MNGLMAKPDLLTLAAQLMLGASIPGMKPLQHTGTPIDTSLLRQHTATPLEEFPTRENTATPIDQFTPRQNTAAPVDKFEPRQHTGTPVMEQAAANILAASEQPPTGEGKVIPPELEPLAQEAKKRKIVVDKDMPSSLEGYYDEKTNTIKLNKNLSPQRREEIIRHEMVHTKQALDGNLPTSKFSPDMKDFVDYLSDPSEVSARAAETGEKIPKIFNEVFKLREQKIKGTLSDRTPLEIESIHPVVKTVIEPEIPINNPHEKYLWTMRRLGHERGINKIKAVKVERKSIRINFKNKANGIIAESKLKDLGIDAFSNAPFSVDITMSPENIFKMKEIGFKLKNLNKNLLQLPESSKLPTPTGEGNEEKQLETELKRQFGVQ